ncbi:Sm-like protein LSm1 [Wickerhamiella sorbophila]|uniref:U6 snRNA-associated Sm-like protein LSm1 n=1 Tax=Wickerhamiella sorbophila TaxID=45607 RepID=A0A2T0FCI6_9ASCO|nr:Sm-like protein LSm1 [Wickerhamiella sorbophila]PRT52718.1 Sm-like protein LSm1 [Wickerhamiella sorbophila]
MNDIDDGLMPLQVFTTAASLLELVDKKVTLSLRNGRTLFGVLRSFDSYGNLVVQETVERIYLEGKYAEADRGVLIIRGENLALLGEIDLAKEEELEAKHAGLEKIDFDQASDEFAKRDEKLKEDFLEKEQIRLQAGLFSNLVADHPYRF